MDLPQIVKAMQGERFVLPFGSVVVFKGRGRLIINDPHEGRTSNIRVRVLTERTAGPFKYDRSCEFAASASEIRYALIDLTMVSLGVLQSLTSLPVGTQANVIDGNIQTNLYWNGTAWVDMATAPSNGVNGASAYQVAVNNGFVGDQTAWLASLKGAKGDTGPAGNDGQPGADGVGEKGDRGDVGPTPSNTTLNALIAAQIPAPVKGDTGAAGANGKSAYELAVIGGYSGTQSQWLASLVGAKGDVGLTGKSAYELAVAGGYVGTQSQWLASLVGSTGAAGQSAYQLAVAAGFVGTNAQWLASLVGATGATGPTGPSGAVSVGTITLTETAVVAINAGVRKLTVALTGTLTTGNYAIFPTAATPAGYALHDAICVTAGQLTVSLTAPLLAIGASYSITCRVMKIG